MLLCPVGCSQCLNAGLGLTEFIVLLLCGHCRGFLFSSISLSGLSLLKHKGVHSDTKVYNCTKVYNTTKVYNGDHIFKWYFVQIFMGQSQG